MDDIQKKVQALIGFVAYKAMSVEVFRFADYFCHRMMPKKTATKAEKPLESPSI